MIEEVLRGRGKDGIHLRVRVVNGNISDAFAGISDLTPLCRVLLHTRFRTILLLAFSLSAVSAPASRSQAAEQESCASRIPGAERLSAHA